MKLSHTSKSLLKEARKHLDLAKKIKVGYTTYFSLMQCNGEDDSPQWGESAYDVELDVSPVSVPVAD